MNRKIYLILVVLLIAISSVIAVMYSQQSVLLDSLRSIESNSAKEIVVSTGERVTIGEEMEPGFYDISYVANGSTENIIFNGLSLSGEDKLLNVPLKEGFKFTLIVEDLASDNKAKLYFKPSSFDKLNANEYGEFILKHTGYYLIGYEIPPGKYKVTLISTNSFQYEGMPDVQLRIYKDISATKGNKKIHLSNVGETKYLSMEDNEVLYLYKIREGLDYKISGNVTSAMGFEANDLEVVLQLVE